MHNSVKSHRCCLLQGHSHQVRRQGDVYGRPHGALRHAHTTVPPRRHMQRCRRQQVSSSVDAAVEAAPATPVSTQEGLLLPLGAAGAWDEAAVGSPVVSLPRLLWLAVVFRYKHASMHARDAILCQIVPMSYLACLSSSAPHGSLPHTPASKVPTTRYGWCADAAGTLLHGRQRGALVHVVQRQGQRRPRPGRPGSGGGLHRYAILF